MKIPVYKRLEFLRSSKTAKEYLTGKNVADKSLLYTFEDHNLFIKRSEEKWTAREDLNEVERTIKLKLLKEVKTINRYRESKNNLTDMIEEAEYQRFKFYKILD
ncbi:hypothetical protein KSF78_0004584 [Schistosoma japonicum]|nr:hypothetical protein KSF78_0004584 [Schistosoma japonicum]